MRRTLAAALALACLLPAGAEAFPLRGTVVDALGLPVPDARVRVYDPSRPDGVPARSALTGADGRFEIAGLSDGVHVIECEDSRREPWSEARALDSASARDVRIVMRTRAESAVHVPAEGIPAVTVRAFVTGESGEPLPRAVVVVDDRFELTDETGRCVIERVFSGRRKVKVVAGGYETFRGETFLEPGARELSVPLRREVAFATVHGAIRIKRRGDADLPPVKVLFGERIAVADARGKFRIEGVRAGRVPVTLICAKREVHSEIVEVRKGDFAFEVLLDRLP